MNLLFADSWVSFVVWWVLKASALLAAATQWVNMNPRTPRMWIRTSHSYTAGASLP